MHARGEYDERHVETGKPRKTYWWERPDGTPGLNGHPEKSLPLYGIPELEGLPDGAAVVVTEGEPAAKALREHGIPAVGTVTGAKTTHDAECFRPLLRFCVVLWADHDDDGRRHMELTAAQLRAISHSDVRRLTWAAAPPKGDAVDFFAGLNTAEDARALVASAERLNTPPTAKSGPWAKAMAASEFLAEVDKDVSWLWENVLAPGSLTEMFSPRGLGKTHSAYAMAVGLARAGVRVLLLDRDNSRREVKRRLRAWGAADLTTLRVLLRDDVPPLTDAPAWANFPFREWDLAIVDSLDATTEGVGEKDSSKPSKAIAPLLDIAHRADGPAILCLGNTIKSGEHSRGSGVVEDRADVAYEVRDATDFRPTGQKDWWLELPAAGVGAWGERASRRKRRDTYRLAFIPSKFRIGQEPEPFVYEIDLREEPWQMRLVTADIVAAGQEASAKAERERADRQTRGTAGLVGLMAERAKEGRPLNTEEVVSYLRDEHGFTRRGARDLLGEQNGVLWEAKSDPSKHGHPRLWYPVLNPAAARSDPAKSPLSTPDAEEHLSADRMDRARRKDGDAETRINSGDSENPLLAAEPNVTGGSGPEQGRDEVSL